MQREGYIEKHGSLWFLLKTKKAPNSYYVGGGGLKTKKACVELAHKNNINIGE